MNGGPPATPPIKLGRIPHILSSSVGSGHEKPIKLRRIPHIPLDRYPASRGSNGRMPSYLLEPTPECLGGERGASAELVDHPSPGERDSSPTHPLSWETIVGMDGGRRQALAAGHHNVRGSSMAGSVKPPPARHNRTRGVSLKGGWVCYLSLERGDGSPPARPRSLEPRRFAVLLPAPRRPKGGRPRPSRGVFAAGTSALPRSCRTTKGAQDDRDPSAVAQARVRTRHPSLPGSMACPRIVHASSAIGSPGRPEAWRATNRNLVGTGTWLIGF